MSASDMRGTEVPAYRFAHLGYGPSASAREGAPLPTPPAEGKTLARTQRPQREEMAGIGFALERLYRSASLGGRMASFAHASIVAAGPCLLAVVAIWLIGASNNELEGKTTIATFRAVIIYSFALSFVITAPVALVSARLISDKLHDRALAPIPGIMLAGLLFSAALSIGTAAALFGLALGLGWVAAIAAIADCALIALIWVACLFCSVTRDYTWVTAYFAAGMTISVLGVTFGYSLRPDLETMLWGFNLGLGVTLFGLLTRIFSTFPFAVPSIAVPSRELLQAAV